MTPRPIMCKEVQGAVCNVPGACEQDGCMKMAFSRTRLTAHVNRNAPVMAQRVDAPCSRCATPPLCQETRCRYDYRDNPAPLRTGPLAWLRRRIGL